MAERFTGRFDIMCHAQSRNARLDHPHAHWVMKLKKLWKEELVNLRKVFEDSERNDEVLNWKIGLVAVGQDDKTSVPVPCEIPGTAVAHQSGRGAMVPSGRTVHKLATMISRWTRLFLQSRTT
jgi:hypothetical protein